MPHNDYVSVTIVTYNSGRFIKRCLESVLEQKYDKKEIIVIDNASTDGTVDILEQFEDSCRIVYNPKTSVLPPPRTRRSIWRKVLGFLRSIPTFCCCRISSRRWSMPARWTRGSARFAASC